MNLRSPCLTCDQRKKDKMFNKKCENCQTRRDYIRRIGHPGLPMDDGLVMPVEKGIRSKVEGGRGDAAGAGHLSACDIQADASENIQEDFMEDTQERINVDGVDLLVGRRKRKNGAVPLLDANGVVAGLICAGCGEAKPLSGFYRHNKSHYGYAARCKLCNDAAARTSDAKNPPSVPPLKKGEDRGDFKNGDIPPSQLLHADPVISQADISKAIERGIATGIEHGMVRISARLIGWMDRFIRAI